MDANAVDILTMIGTLATALILLVAVAARRL